MAAMPAVEQPTSDAPQSAEDELLDAFLNLSVPPGFRAELIEGEIVVTPPPDGDHEDAFDVICAELHSKSQLKVSVSGTKGLITPRGRYIPDGTVVQKGGFRGQDSWMPAENVLLVFEITSTRPANDREAKRLGYAAAGIPIYLLVDRTAGTVTLFTDPKEGDYRDHHRVPFGTSLDLPDPFGFTLDTADLA